MKIAVLYQYAPLPPIDGVQKPMKPGGYSDSGADIACCLRQNGVAVATPVPVPETRNDLDWVFPDTPDGIRQALSLGADTLWLNTSLYAGHPILQFPGLFAVGQAPGDMERYEDKRLTNQFLEENGYPVAGRTVLASAGEYAGPFPCVLKPIRGRGSQGVRKCGDRDELRATLSLALESGKYGDRMMAEPYLPGREVTVSVLPGGRCLPVVERLNHADGVAPYSGDVPVTQNSRAVLPNDGALEALCASCGKAVRQLGLKALVRIDCRQDSRGNYLMFDFNLKPNMTGAARPHRQDQDSLTMIAARALGWSYFDLLRTLLDTRWRVE